MKHIRMSRAAAEKWLKGLRSGKYKQGSGRLQDANGNFCCMGVLQMVLDGDVDRTSSGASLIHVPTAWLAEQGITFYNVDGIAHNNPYLSKFTMHATSASDLGHAFNELADAIEAELEYTD